MVPVTLQKLPRPIGQVVSVRSALIEVAADFFVDSPRASLLSPG